MTVGAVMSNVIKIPQGFVRTFSASLEWFRHTRKRY